MKLVSYASGTNSMNLCQMHTTPNFGHMASGTVMPGATVAALACSAMVATG